MSDAIHSHYMRLALNLAAQGRASVSPNPMVGCVLVKNGAVVGSGYHQRAGEAHAEIHALQTAGEAARGASAYLNLEPCCHYGKTPPCVDALINAGVEQVFIATQDPNPLVAGRGIAQLQAAGIAVSVGIEAQQALQLNQIFFHYIVHKKPFVIAKWAMSLDGKTIATAGDSPTISSATSRLHAHQLRHEVDAILIGANTARRDDPQLTSRIDNPKKQPLRVVLTATGNLSLDLKLFSEDLPGKTWVMTTDRSSQAWRAALQEKNIAVFILNHTQDGLVDLSAVLRFLGERQITSLLIEGGAAVHQSFFNENLVNQIQVYVAPVIIANYLPKKFLGTMQATQLDQDFVFVADCGGSNHV